MKFVETVEKSFLESFEYEKRTRIENHPLLASEPRDEIDSYYILSERRNKEREPMEDKSLMKGSIYKNLYKAKNVRYTDAFFENNKLESYDQLKDFILANYKDIELMDYQKHLRDWERIQMLKNQKKTYMMTTPQTINFTEESDRVWNFLANNLVLNS